MNALTFLIKLNEPLLATQAQSGEANSAVSYPFIPGSMLRGAIINGYVAENDINALDISDDETIRPLFFNGDVCYLNAYLAHPAQNERMLPRPFSWFVPKDSARNPNEMIMDYAVDPNRQLDSPPKAPGLGDFVWQAAGSIQLGSPSLQMTVHNASDNRSLKDEIGSQVYRYDALAAGQIFAGVIISEDKDLLLKEIKPVLEKSRFNLGGSYTAGYGQVEIFDIVPDLSWEEYTLDTTPANQDTITLTCLSDVIIRGAGGQVGQGLAELAGDKPVRSFHKMRLVGGFNRTWGLPLPQDWAIEAGSVFVFPASCKAELDKWVTTGVGERQTEGFGRVAVNWHSRANQDQSKIQTRTLTISPPDKLSADSQKLAQKMAKRQLQSRLDTAVIKKTNALSKTLKTLPSPTQLSRARLAARRAWLSDSPDRLTEITRHFKGLSNLSKQEWGNSYIRDGADSHQLDHWICNMAENPNSFTLSYLGIGLPEIAGEPADFIALHTQTVARLVEGVLGRAVKKAKQERQGGQHE